MKSERIQILLIENMQSETTRVAQDFSGILNSQVSQVSNISKFLIESILNVSAKEAASSQNLQILNAIQGNLADSKSADKNNTEQTADEIEEDTTDDQSKNKTTIESFQRATSTPKIEELPEKVIRKELNSSFSPNAENDNLSPVRRTDNKVSKQKEELQNFQRNLLYSNFGNGGLNGIHQYSGVPGIAISQNLQNLYKNASSSLAQFTSTTSPSSLVGTQPTNQIAADSLSLFNYLQQAAVLSSSCNPATLLVQSGHVTGAGSVCSPNQQMENYSRLLALGIGLDQNNGPSVLLSYLKQLST